MSNRLISISSLGVISLHSHGVYSVLQANTVLEMYYTETGFSGNPAWVIVGNPVVLSSSTYTIYANGLNAQSAYETINKSYTFSFIDGSGANTYNNMKVLWLDRAKGLCVIFLEGGTSANPTHIPANVKFTLPSGITILSYFGMNAWQEFNPNSSILYCSTLSDFHISGDTNHRMDCRATILAEITT